jgi:hypothetical protein
MGAAGRAGREQHRTNGLGRAWLLHTQTTKQRTKASLEDKAACTKKLDALRAQAWEFCTPALRSIA